MVIELITINISIPISMDRMQATSERLVKFLIWIIIIAVLVFCTSPKRDLKVLLIPMQAI